MHGLLRTTAVHITLLNPMLLESDFYYKADFV